MQGCNASNSNATSVIIRRVSSTCWPNTRTASCTFRAVPIRPTSSHGSASPMARARRHTRGTTSRIRRSSSSLFLARPPLPPSWPPVPLHEDFAAAVRAALPSDPVLGPFAAAVQAQGDPSAACPSRSAFVCRDGLLYRGRCCRSVRTCTTRSSTPPGGMCSSRWGTRCCWTPSTRPSRRARCSPHGELVPSGSSRALRQTRTGSTSPRRRDVAHLPRVQRRTPAPPAPTTCPPRRPLRCRPTTASGRPGRCGRARGAGAAQV